MEDTDYISVVPLDVLPSPFGCSVFFKTPSKIFVVNMDSSKFDNIKWALDDICCDRPTTFEFIRSMLAGMHCDVVRVDFYNEEDSVFFTRITLAIQSVFESKIVEIDSRPSDAIPLALRCGSSIYIAPNVLSRLDDVSETYYKLKENI